MAVSMLQDLVIEDEIYGKVILDARADAVLIQLIAAPAFVRLKRVLQHGISAVSSIGVSSIGGRPSVTRYAHSIGACLLVRRLGASLEEQVAALLHDIAHTALSHTIDAAWGRVVHEEDKLRFLDTTTIPSIISAHGFDPDRVLEESNYSLLERDAPRLCGDRLDYALRDSFAFGIISSAQIASILRDIISHEGEIVCTSVSSARLLSDAYMESDRVAWSNAAHATLYQFAAEAIREAFDVGQLQFEDLYASPSCEAFWQGLVESPHISVRTLAERVKGDIRVREVSAEEADQAPNTLQLELKPRVLDPTVLRDGSSKTASLTELDQEYATKVDVYRKSKKGRRTFVLE